MRKKCSQCASQRRVIEACKKVAKMATRMSRVALEDSVSREHADGVDSVLVFVGEGHGGRNEE